MIFTIEAYKKELDKRLKTLDEAKLIFTCASSAHARMVKRIFVRGKNRRNQDHGEYSTDDIYINTTKTSPRTLQGVGKTGKSVFKSGRKHKTTFFGGGYKSFKQKIGRGGDVNFWLFGQLKLDFTNSLQRKGKGWISGIKNAANIKKFRNLIRLYGRDSWQFDKKILKKYNKCIKIKLDKQLLNVPVSR